ncbi:hypothetical protein TWF481_000820 [Arthrobotrys musiformis]|uniref:Peroxin 20 n=1 Tax=Arthrobotrys musiformis TaxID=47236 RepID=A0AAV9WNW9_9PEZI
MASSSMCGPSNPLQSLKNHASFDRSLQQDRFRSQPGAAPSQQFRQQSHLIPQQHDEFEQFLGASPAGPSQSLQTRPSLQNFAIAAPPSPAALHHQSGWASDFQRLQISTPPPPSLQIHKPAATGWGAEFLSQLNASPAQSISQQNAPVGSSFMGMNTGYMPMASMQHSSSYEPLQSNHVDSKTSYTDAEFDQMFEEAATLHSDVMDFPQREVPNPLQNTNVMPLQPESEDVKEDAKEEQDKSRDDADELARTAGQLVDTLSQDTSRKFQESQFVALMRKLRDKTVKVEDGKMVEV